MRYTMLSTSDIRKLSPDQRYALIEKLINAEVDERVEEDFPTSGYDSEEEFRDDQIAHLCSFLKEDLQSDNA